MQNIAGCWVTWKLKESEQRKNFGLVHPFHGNDLNWAKGICSIKGERLPDYVINHMTMPHLQWRDLLAASAELGCSGVEFRNDLPAILFSGDAPQVVEAEARRQQQRIVGLSQVYPFNSWSDAIADEVAALIATANSCGAETISLIPRNDVHRKAMVKGRPICGWHSTKFVQCLKRQV